MVVSISMHADSAVGQSGGCGDAPVTFHRGKTGTFISPQGEQTWQWLKNPPN